MQRRNTLTSLNGDGPYGWALLGLVAALWLLAAAGSSGVELLCYQRLAIGHGQVWRLLTGHWVHLGVRHLLMDSAGLVLIWALYARTLPPFDWLLLLLGATAAIDAGLWWGEPQVEWYVGISGLLHAAWAAGATAWALRGGIGVRAQGVLMLAALAAKLVLERHGSASLFDPSMPVMTAAHAYGAAAGVLGGGLAALRLAPRVESL